MIKSNRKVGILSSSVAGSFLGVAIRYATSNGLAVDGVGAGVVLDGAAALEGGAGVDKGVAVDGEGAGTSGGLNWWCCAAECAGEFLDVGTCGCWEGC